VQRIHLRHRRVAAVAPLVVAVLCKGHLDLLVVVLLLHLRTLLLALLLLLLLLLRFAPPGLGLGELLLFC
jgi:hypothetical protein